ncbi:hypothetical protein ABNG02_15180 [Halorubrum ejinorense]|uniref:Uncharacterized protein n=1 Tax=Halorubrum ejinorense TaxID=425309 RepID=A0ABV4IQ50_9EURY
MAVDSSRRGKTAAGPARSLGVNDGEVDDGEVDDGEVDDGGVDDGEVDDGEVDDGGVDDGGVDDGEVDDDDCRRRSGRSDPEAERCAGLFIPLDERSV